MSNEEPPPNCPVETSILPGTELTYDEGNGGVILVHARNRLDRPVVMHLLATTTSGDEPDHVCCWPPVVVPPHGVVEVHTIYDPAGGVGYGTHLRLRHSRFAREGEAR